MASKGKGKNSRILDQKPVADVADRLEKSIARRVPIGSEAVDLDTPLSCGVTLRQIAQMKKAGMERPEFIPYPDWESPLRLNHRQMLLAHLAALGYKTRDIVSATHFAQGTVERYLKMEVIQQQIQLIRDVEMKGLSLKQTLDRQAVQATRVYDEILYDTSGRAKLSLKQKTAQDVLDRKLGKPQQNVTHEGGLLKDFYAIMEKFERAKQVSAITSKLAESEKPADAEIVVEAPKEAPKPETPPIDRDAMENWHKENFS